jgi:hypothetical protein
MTAQIPGTSIKRGGFEKFDGFSAKLPKSLFLTK